MRKRRATRRPEAGPAMLVVALAAGMAAAPGSGAPAETGPPLVETARERGLEFRHFAGGSGRRYAVEVMGSGGGFLDYDMDGDLDVLLLDGAPLPGTADPEPPPRNRLFRNDGHGRFQDATAGSGLGHAGYGMGIAAGDVDGDGAPDVLVTAFGRDALYRNLGDGRFEEITAQAGVGDERWTSSAVFFDYDGDGDLDLYVAGYLDLDPAEHRPCRIRGVEVHCGPDSFEGIPDRLYRNDGVGGFEDVTEAAGLAELAGKGLGVVAGDIDGDGRQDLYVANDGTANFLLLNRSDAGGPAFEEAAVLWGAAYGEGARAEAGMGTDLGDYDGDGDLDLVCTNLESEASSLYRNEAGTALTESSFLGGIGAPTLPWVGFGVRFFDYDSDGDLDLFMTHGHIMDNVAELRQGARFAQPNLLFENSAGRFQRVCPDCFPEGVGRGLASGDVDGDGDLDLLVTNNGGAPYLFENRAPRKGAVIGLQLEGTGAGSNRDAYGARVSWRFGSAELVRERRAAGSYCSSSDPRLLLAVPAGTDRAEVSIRWPDGQSETLTLTAGAYHRVRQGRGVQQTTPFTAGARP